MPIGSIRDKAEGRELKEGPKFGIATGRPTKKFFLIKRKYVLSINTG
jgi:hypothetical protein